MQIKMGNSVVKIFKKNVKKFFVLRTDKIQSKPSGHVIVWIHFLFINFSCDVCNARKGMGGHSYGGERH